MADVYMKHGNPQMADYTPSGSAVVAGQVITINAAAGLTCVVAHHDIAVGEKGAVAVRGGIYDCINLDNAALGTKVYFAQATKKVTTTATSNARRTTGGAHRAIRSAARGRRNMRATA